jgi:hypothetical protein
VTAIGIVYGLLLLAPIAALWVVAFDTTVPVWGLAVFIAAYVGTVVLATSQSVYILIIVRRQGAVNGPR